MFWSLLLEPGKRYTKVVDSPFHISAAVLDTTTQDHGIVRVIVDIGDTEAHIANLSLKHGILQFPLDLQFESGSRISFYTTGAKCNVHLSGYVLFDEEELPSDEEDDISEEEEEEDVPTLVTAPAKRKPEDNLAATANKKAKVQKVAAATLNNAAPVAAKAAPAAAKASPPKPTKANAVSNKVVEEEMDSDEDDDDEEEEVELDDSDEGEEEEEEDDEDDESDDDDEEEEEDEDEDDVEELANLKQALKANAVKANQLPNKDQINLFKLEKTPKSAKTPKGEKQTPKGAATPGGDSAKTPKGAEGGKTPKSAKTPGSEGAKTPKGAKIPGGEGGKTPKGAKTPGGEVGAPDKSKKTPKQQGVPTQNGKTPKSGTPAAKDQAKSPQTPKVVKPGGVVCEDLVVGKGPEAKSGKMVSVYYEGRLVTNKKMFDKCDSGKGFKFRLGGGEVIKGWDVGVSGMRIGGKRKITCPPHMAYGKKGAPPDIPGNAALSFVVELKGIS